ncbi:MAG: YicC family protein, partial [Lentisphaeraceae bacterium]|nr:YicC family protein [Lentisphaeraceae bacterium]
DISSVNRKQLDFRFSPPREAIFLESFVRKTIPESVARGVINVQMKLNATGDSAAGIQFNDAIIKSYVSHLQQLNKHYDLKTPVSLNDIHLLPGAVQSAEKEISVDDLSSVAAEALKTALEALVKNRHNEGIQLKTDMNERREILLKGLEGLKEKSAQATINFREKLEARIREAGLTIELDSERIHQEVVFYADKSDITEELVRLEAHLKQFAVLIEKEGPVGRELDFLIQEIGREVNTTGSKSSDNNLSRIVVTMKAELERCREQIQNVE